MQGYIRGMFNPGRKYFNRKPDIGYIDSTYIPDQTNGLAGFYKIEIWVSKFIVLYTDL